MLDRVSEQSTEIGTRRVTELIKRGPGGEHNEGAQTRGELGGTNLQGRVIYCVEDVELIDWEKEIK